MYEKLKYYIKKLRHIPSKELFPRLIVKLSGYFSDIYSFKVAVRRGTDISDDAFFKKLGLNSDPGSSEDILMDKVISNKFLNSIMNENRADFIVSKLNDIEKNNIIQKADQILRHQFDLLGSGSVECKYGLIPEGVEGHSYKNNFSINELEVIKDNIREKLSGLIGKENNISKINYEPIDWHVDFKSGHRWNKDVWYRKIEYGDKPGADIKVPWELSRLQHFILLGQAYKVSGNIKYAYEYFFQIVDWIENNKPQFGVNWKCTMDVAIRAANMIAGLSFFKDSPIAGNSFLLYLCKSLFLHGLHIMKNLEYSSITSNHYLSDISGLYFISELFIDFAIGKKWKKFVLREIKREIKKQVYGDGVDYEASICYHRLVLELLFFPVVFETVEYTALKDKNYRDIAIDIFGKNTVDTIYRMFNFVSHCMKPNGGVPRVGDNDNGRLFIYGHGNTLDMRYLLTLGAVFYEEPAFKIKNLDGTREFLWVFGEKGYDIWSNLIGRNLSDIKSYGFADSGFYILRNDDNYLFCNCGPNGQKGNGGHAHNDKLSFELTCRGRDIIIDSGTYLYTAVPEMRNRFRSTSYHNTVMIDGKEQNDYDSNNLFSLGNDIIPVIKRWDQSKKYDLLAAEHPGYMRLEEPVMHRRYFFFDRVENIWMIKDYFYGEGEHVFDFYFNIGPGIKAYLNNKDLIIEPEERADEKLKIIPLIEQKFDAYLTDSWNSCSYGEKTESKLLDYRISTGVPFEAVFIISKKPRTYILKSAKRILNLVKC